MVKNPEAPAKAHTAVPLKGGGVNKKVGNRNTISESHLKFPPTRPIVDIFRLRACILFLQSIAKEQDLNLGTAPLSRSKAANPDAADKPVPTAVPVKAEPSKLHPGQLGQQGLHLKSMTQGLLKSQLLAEAVSTLKRAHPKARSKQASKSSTQPSLVEQTPLSDLVSYKYTRKLFEYFFYIMKTPPQNEWVDEALDKILLDGQAVIDKGKEQQVRETPETNPSLHRHMLNIIKFYVPRSSQKPDSGMDESSEEETARSLQEETQMLKEYRAQFKLLVAQVNAAVNQKMIQKQVKLRQNRSAYTWFDRSPEEASHDNGHHVKDEDIEVKVKRKLDPEAIVLELISVVDCLYQAAIEAVEEKQYMPSWMFVDYLSRPIEESIESDDESADAPPVEQHAGNDSHPARVKSPKGLWKRSKKPKNQKSQHHSAGLLQGSQLDASNMAPLPPSPPVVSEGEITSHYAKIKAHFLPKINCLINQHINTIAQLKADLSGNHATDPVPPTDLQDEARKKMKKSHLGILSSLDVVTSVLMASGIGGKPRSKNQQDDASAAPKPKARKPVKAPKQKMRKMQIAPPPSSRVENISSVFSNTVTSVWNFCKGMGGKTKESST